MANIQNILTLAEGLRRNLHVMVGWEEMLLSSLIAGAHGCMVASGGILPKLMTAILRHYRANQLGQVARLQRLVAKTTEEMKKVFFPYGYKLGMQARGFDMGPFAIDIPAAYALQLQEQQKKIAETIKKVVQEVETNSTTANAGG